jgi:hypothetical protein
MAKRKTVTAPVKKLASRAKRDSRGRFISKRKQFFNKTVKTRETIRSITRKRNAATNKGVKTRYNNKIKSLLKDLKKAAARTGVQNVKVKGESSGKSSQKGKKTAATSKIRKAKGSAKAKSKKTNKRTRKTAKRK